MTEIEKETGMTDAECEYWDEYITKNPVRLGPDLVKLGIKPGCAHNYLPLNELAQIAELSADEVPVTQDSRKSVSS
jgi:hypothetical protein